MPAFVEAALKRHIDQFDPDDDRLITTARGHLLRRSHYDQNILKPALTAAALPRRSTFHTLRHSHASTALAASLPILELYRHLGHANTAETTDSFSPTPTTAPATPSTACGAVMTTEVTSRDAATRLEVKAQLRRTEKRRTGQKSGNSTAPTATRRGLSTPMATRTYAEPQLETCRT